MATAPKRQVGTMKCLCCGHEIPVKAATNGTLNAACAWCDFPAYAKAGTEAHRIIMGKLENRPEPENKAPTATKKVADPGPAPVPEPSKKMMAACSTIFDLGRKA